MTKRRLSPQEKKANSYAKDRRNDYGENDKSSRKNIPLSKARAQRAVRRTDKSKLRTDPLSDAIRENRPKPAWKKCPDLPLGAELEFKSQTSERDSSLDYPSSKEMVRRRIKRLKSKRKSR